MSFFDGLPIYYINLDRHRERNERLLRSFKECGIHSYRRISGFDGTKKRLRVLQADYQEALGNRQSAVVLSYFKLVQTFLFEEQSDYILMCDDDIDFFNALKIDFNFYDTLQYHNPEYYNLKVVTNDQASFHYYVPVAKLHKAPVTTYGQATIINKKWAELFLKRYNMLDEDISYESTIDVRPYKSNVNDSNPTWIIPNCDALNFDENTYIWRVFPCFHTEDSSVGIPTIDPQTYVDSLNACTNKLVLEELTFTDRRLTLESFREMQ